MKENILAEKSKKFALRIIKLYMFLKNEKHETIMSRQLLRCGTSIGANISESVYAQSKPDFITKLTIALKEASETKYWLELLAESSVINFSQIEDLKNECVELIKILTSSINTSKKK